MKKNRFVLLSLAATLSITLFGCGVVSSVSNSIPNAEQIEKLEHYGSLLKNAQIIEVSEDPFSANREYDITIDGEEFGEVEGKYFNVTGDVFTLEDEAGNVWGSEKQIKRWGVKLNRLAEVMSPEGATVGYIGEEKVKDLFKYGYSFHFYDTAKNEIGHSDQVFFSLTKQYKIKDNNGNLLYKIKGDFLSLVNTYTIEVIDSSVVPVEQAIFLTCILDAISTADTKK